MYNKTNNQYQKVSIVDYFVHKSLIFGRNTPFFVIIFLFFKGNLVCTWNGSLYMSGYL